MLQQYCGRPCRLSSSSSCYPSACGPTACSSPLGTAHTWRWLWLQKSSQKKEGEIVFLLTKFYVQCKLINNWTGLCLCIHCILETAKIRQIRPIQDQKVTSVNFALCTHKSVNLEQVQVIVLCSVIYCCVTVMSGSMQDKSCAEVERESETP